MRPAGLLLSERSPLSLRLSLEGKEPSLLLQTDAFPLVTSPLPLRRWPLQACDAHSPARHLIFAGHYLIAGGVQCAPVRKLHASPHRQYEATEKLPTL